MLQLRQVRQLRHLIYDPNCLFAGRVRKLPSRDLCGHPKRQTARSFLRINCTNKLPSLRQDARRCRPGWEAARNATKYKAIDKTNVGKSSQFAKFASLERGKQHKSFYWARQRKVVATTAAAWWQGSNLPALDGTGTIKRKTFLKQAPKRNWQQTAAFKSPLSHQRNWPGQLLMANYKCLCVWVSGQGFFCQCPSEQGQRQNQRFLGTFHTLVGQQEMHINFT